MARVIRTPNDLFKWVHNRLMVQNYTRHDLMLWAGEMCVTLFIHVGTHGRFSAVIVIQRVDDALTTVSQNFYKGSLPGMSIQQRLQEATDWAWVQLHDLCQPEPFAHAVGIGQSDIVALDH